MGAEAVFYTGGVVYTSNKRKVLRVIKCLPNYAAESSVPWGGPRPTLSAWKEAIAKINTCKP